MTQTMTKIFLALFALNMFSACLVEFDDQPPRRTTTTTTTTTTEEHHHDEVIVEEEIIIEEVVHTPIFHPTMGAVSAEVVAYNDRHHTSWQLYTFNFTDEADTYTCGPNMAAMSQGTVATLFVNGYEIDDEFASCPQGRYNVVAECELYEGEACAEIVERDGFGREVATDYATHGVIDIRLVPALHHGEPHRCIIDASVNGNPNMSVDFELFFDSYDLAPYTDEGSSICTI